MDKSKTSAKPMQVTQNQDMSSSILDWESSRVGEIRLRGSVHKKSCAGIRAHGSVSTELQEMKGPWATDTAINTQMHKSSKHKIMASRQCSVRTNS